MIHIVYPLIDHLKVAPPSMQFVSRFPSMFGIRQPFETGPRIVCDAPCWRSSTLLARLRTAKMNVTSRLESYAVQPIIAMECIFCKQSLFSARASLCSSDKPWVHCKTLNCLEFSSAPPKGAAETWDLGVKGNQISAAPNLVPRENRTFRREKGPVSTFHASELCGSEGFIKAYMIFLGCNAHDLVHR